MNLREFEEIMKNMPVNLREVKGVYGRDFA